MSKKTNIIKKANSRLEKLVKKIIKDKNLIKSGDLFKSVDVKFNESKGEINLEIIAMEYYTYLDDGTKYIKSKNITNDIINSFEFEKIIDEMITDITYLEVDETFRKLENKNIKIK